MCSRKSFVLCQDSFFVFIFNIYVTFALSVNLSNFDDLLMVLLLCSLQVLVVQ